MKRRTIPAVIAAALLYLPTAPAHAAGRPPNVVMIIGDDQGWTDYSFMGHPQVRTPHLDRLASQGLTLRRGYVCTSLCSPSLASMLTGLYPHQHKITSNDPPPPAGAAPRDPANDPAYRARRRELISNFERVPTLPRMLAEKGYVSFQAGKWWGGNYRTGGFTDGMSHGDPARGGRHGDEGLEIGRKTMQPVFDFMTAARGKDAPFFLWYAPMLPHQPHDPPARLLDRYRDKTPSLPVAKYWAMCEWFDETCGQLLGFLDDQGLADDTLVVFLADNGWIQDPGADRFAPKSKRSPYDGGLRTPIVLRWPGKIRPRDSGLRAISIDLAPTILAAAGLKPSPEMPGVNLLEDSALAARPAIFGEVFTHDAVDLRRPATSLCDRWAIAGDRKLILPSPRNVPDGAAELYDLASDPFETRNLAGREAPEVARLTGLLDAWWTPED